MTDANHEALNYASGAAMPDTGFMSQIQTIIRQKTPDHTFGVPELAESLHLSRSQLNRKLHFQTGHSPGRLILSYRMEVACKLLQETFLSVKEISNQCGFSSTSAFCRKFKNLYGKNPTDFRETSFTLKKLPRREWTIPLNDSGYANLVICSQRFHWLGSLIGIFIKNLDNETLSTIELARALYISPSQLNRKVQGLFGVPVTQFLRDLKLQYALELLCDKKHSITQVAAMSGFFDSAHMSRHFKQVFGTSPGKLKLSHCSVQVISGLKKLYAQQSGN